MDTMDKKYCMAFKILPLKRELGRKLTPTEIDDCIAEVNYEGCDAFTRMEMNIMSMFESDNEKAKDDLVTAMTGISMEDGAVGHG